MNVIARLELELAYYNAAVPHVSPYATKNLSNIHYAYILCFMREIYNFLYIVFIHYEVIRFFFTIYSSRVL